MTAPLYCPRCTREVRELAAHRQTYGGVYDCATCETILFAAELDKWPGQTKGKDEPIKGGVK